MTIANNIENLIYNLIEERIMKKKEQTNFMQVGETVECSHCHPERYTDLSDTFCQCKCHRLNDKPMIMDNSKVGKEYQPYGEEWEKEMMKLPKPIMLKIAFKAGKAQAKQEALEIAKREYDSSQGHVHASVLIKLIENL